MINDVKVNSWNLEAATVHVAEKTEWASIIIYCFFSTSNIPVVAMRQEAVAHLSQENVMSGINIKIMEVKWGRTSHMKKQNR